MDCDVFERFDTLQILDWLLCVTCFWLAFLIGKFAFIVGFVRHLRSGAVSTASYKKSLQKLIRQTGWLKVRQSIIERIIITTYKDRHY